MRAKRRRAASPTNSAGIHVASCSLLALPVGVLHHILGMLGLDELTQLLHTSKAIAEQVMQHSAGRLTLKVDLHKKINWAATRQLLHWAPTSCLKLMLAGTWADHSPLGELLDAPCTPSPGLNSHQMQHPQMQQLPCIVEVHVQDFTLPSLVPAGIAALCPNLHTLRLTGCVVRERSRDAGSTGSSSKTGSSSSTTGSVWPAQRLHTVILAGSDVRNMEDYPVGNERVTRSMQPAVQFAEQLKSSLPNMTCLTLQQCPETRQLLAMFGPQLTELHLLSQEDFSGLRWPAAAMHLRHLQKLMLPRVEIASAADVEHLLSLPSLTHLEINSVNSKLEDCSSRPCKWQYLHLHLDLTGLRTGLRLDALAKLPLHSLTHPLVLGRKQSEGGVLLQLPPPGEDGMLATMEHLAQQLTRCGVRLLGAGIVWEPGGSFIINDWLALPQCEAHVPAFMVVAPVFGQQTHVCLSGMIVDLPLMQSFATVYGSSVEVLAFDFCALHPNMTPLWQAALAGLPNAHRVQLMDCYPEDNENEEEEEATMIVEVLSTWAAAMAQQPAGRCMEVVVRCEAFNSRGFTAANETAGVEITVKPANIKVVGAGVDEEEVGVCVRITSKHGS